MPGYTFAVFIFVSSPRNIGALLEYDKVGILYFKIYTEGKY